MPITYFLDQKNILRAFGKGRITSYHLIIYSALLDAVGLNEYNQLLDLCEAEIHLTPDDLPQLLTSFLPVTTNDSYVRIAWLMSAPQVASLLVPSSKYTFSCAFPVLITHDRDSAELYACGIEQVREVGR